MLPKYTFWLHTKNSRALKCVHLNAMNFIIKAIIIINMKVCSPLLATQQLQVRVNWFANWHHVFILKIMLCFSIAFNDIRKPWEFVLQCFSHTVRCFFGISPLLVSLAGHRQVLWPNSSPVRPESGKHVLPCPLHSLPPLPWFPVPLLSAQGRTGADGYLNPQTICLWGR